MRILQINSVCEHGSTGNICVGISKLLNEQNYENLIVYTSGFSSYKNAKKCANDKYIKIQALKSRIKGNYGFNSKEATRTIIKEIEKFDPDIVHIHNIHGHDCNLEELFKFLKNNEKKIVWTFHDCWAFTAYCPYFDMVECNKWQTMCEKCQQYKKYSLFFDRSKNLFEKKKSALEGLDLTIITPSQWLAEKVNQSFLKNYPVKVINNGIDLNVFKPSDSEFKKNYNLENKFVVLGVAFDWDKRKGLDVFIELSKKLDDRFKVVLVGTNETIDKMLPTTIISIHRTKNQAELAEIYTASDLFVNPTREENFPTVNIESLACGTPIVSFETGGSSEIFDKTSGVSVPKNNVEELKQKIISVCEKKVFSKENCVDRAKKFNSEDKFNEYIVLYEQLLK